MDTVNVDIAKLQLLNDRIQQTIDALNQVRYSVHSIASSPIMRSQIPPSMSSFGLSHTGFAPSYGIESAYSAYTPRINPWAQTQSVGLSHTGFDPYRTWQVDPFRYERLFQTFPFLGADPMHAVRPF